ncbi:MAG TPA: TetR family transcriptional regulator [Alphaproteobacteria bacterium]|nr:TetR family transcriptional regulator [Alphaproteobacteria bacterium]
MAKRRKRSAGRKAGNGRAPSAREEARAARGDASPDRIIDTTMDLIAGRGWRNLSLADIASATGLSLAQLYAVFPSKLAVLDAFERRVNERTLAGEVSAEDSIRDRLFDLVMRRLDTLAPHRPAIRALIRDLPLDPSIALCTGPRFLNAMRWMAESAGVDTSGLGGWLRVNGVAAVYVSTLYAWLNDETADNSRTLAALDRALKQAEFFARSIPGFTRPSAAAAA